MSHCGRRPGLRRLGADDGLVLVAVIWLLALLGGLVTAMSIFATNSLSMIAVSGDRPRADAAIEAGLTQAVARLTSTKEPVPGRGRISVGDASVSFSFLAESARIDVNVASAELLAGLFARLGAPSDAATGYAGVIVALRGEPAAPKDASGTAAHPPGDDPHEESPAAIRALTQAGRPEPGKADPHRPIGDTLQLASVPGLPPALMVRAAPYLTSYSGIAEIDPRWAAPLVIEALPGMTRERVRTLLDLRSRPGADAATLDDALGPAKALTTTKPVLSTRITLRAVLADGFTTAAEIVIIVYPDDRTPYRVLSWDDEADLRHAPL